MILLNLKNAKIRGDVLMEGWAAYEDCVVVTGARWSFESPLKSGASRTSAASPGAGGSGGSGGGTGSSGANRSGGGDDSSRSSPWESTVQLDKNLDRASSDLMKLSMLPEQKPIEDVSMHFVETIDEEVWDYLWIKLGQVYLVEWSLNGPEDRRPTESITLGFNQMWMQVTQYDGEAGPGRGWDRKMGQDWTPKGVW